MMNKYNILCIVDAHGLHQHVVNALENDLFSITWMGVDENRYILLKKN